MLEAMAMEIPIITTNVGGNVELIEMPKEGILVDYNNKENFIAQIALCPKTKKIRNALVIQGQKQNKKL